MRHCGNTLQPVTQHSAAGTCLQPRWPTSQQHQGSLVKVLVICLLYYRTSVVNVLFQSLTSLSQYKNAFVSDLWCRLFVSSLGPSNSISWRNWYFLLLKYIYSAKNFGKYPGKFINGIKYWSYEINCTLYVLNIY